jgi:hypothetical protein
MTEVQKASKTTFPETAGARETENNISSEIVSSEVSVTIVQDAEIIENKSAPLRKPQGRKTVLSDEIANRICANVELGLSMAAASKAAGVSHITVGHWLDKGRAGMQPYESFLEKLTKARHQAEAGMAQVVQRCAASDDERISLAAATWWLERRRPERWAKKDMNRVEVKDTTEKLSDSELEQKIRQLAAARGWSGGEK